jgi:hypothetical protein
VMEYHVSLRRSERPGRPRRDSGDSDGQVTDARPGATTSSIYVTYLSRSGCGPGYATTSAAAGGSLSRVLAGGHFFLLFKFSSYLYKWNGQGGRVQFLFH